MRELTTEELINEYNNMLDERGDVIVCGLPFAPSRVLEQLDETAYRCGLNDYYDSVSDYTNCEEMN